MISRKLFAGSYFINKANELPNPPAILHHLSLSLCLFLLHSVYKESTNKIFLHKYAQLDLCSPPISWTRWVFLKLQTLLTFLRQFNSNSTKLSYSRFLFFFPLFSCCCSTCSTLSGGLRLSHLLHPYFREALI